MSGETTDQIDKFCCLGSCISSGGRISDEGSFGIYQPGSSVALRLHPFIFQRLNIHCNGQTSSVWFGDMATAGRGYTKIIGIRTPVSSWHCSNLVGASYQ
ncbi:hypothetical protein D915_010570 [Fasciola hepatica]|uniref:Uncharacterized protein n=1 Tax=Fasciola hepatica TaxID=6192 RepID=A0A4E0RMT0_FASHE|nr:hypothetical protein D915_010570 [Fasciola hepatica]